MRPDQSKEFTTVLVLILLSIIFSGCEEKVTKSETNFDAIVAIILNENPSIFKRDVFDTSQDTFFYREIIKSDFWADVNISEAPPESNYVQEANVEIVDSIKGIFHHFIDGKEYTTDFEATSISKGFLVRWAEISRHRGWILKKVSGNKIFTIPDASSFFSMTIYSSSGDYRLSPSVITSVKSFKDILTFNSGDSLTLELSPTNSADYLYLHYEDGGSYIKRPFVKQNGKFTTGLKLKGSSYQHIFIDIIDKNSIDDSTASYKFSAWGILVQVKE